MPYVTSIERMAKEQGRQEGHQEGLLEGLLESIEFGLELKFGTEGVQLLPEISQFRNIDLLKEIQTGLKKANNLEELRSIYIKD